jgi:tetratricopeptide (TPR) repeat protein
MMTALNTPNQDQFAQIIDRQLELLTDLHKKVAPDAEVEATRLRKLSTIAIRAAAVGGAIVGAILTGNEIIGLLWNNYQNRALAAEYAAVARQVYHIENNPAVAMKFMDQAMELDDSAEYRTDRVYYESMQVVRDLLNLDRPYTQAELDRAHASLAQAILLRNAEPDRAESHILLGQLYTVLKQPEMALAALREAVKIAPTSEFAHMRLGTLLDTQGKTKEALAEFETAINIKPDYKWAYLWKGVLLGEKMAQWPQARQAYQQAIKLDPRFDLAYYNLGWSFINAEPANYAEARKQFEQAIAIRPSYKEAFYGLGMVYGYQNEYGVAENYLSHAVALDDNFLTGWKWRGVVRAEQGKWAGALDDYSKAIALNPIDPSLYLRRGSAYENLHQYDQAAADYRFASHPDTAEARLAQAGLSIKTGELKRAAEHIARALTMEPKSEEAFALRAKWHEQQGNTPAAIADIGRAITLATYRPERFYTQRGELWLKTGQNEKAAADFVKARTINASHAEAWSGEGRACVALGRKELARAALTRYLEIKPQDAAIRTLRQSLTKTKAL